SSFATTVFSSSGELGFSPVQASLQVKFSGVTLNARLIGSTLYIEEPFLAKVLSGRRWLEQQGQSLTQALSLQRSGLGSAGGEPGQEFEHLAKLVAHARSITELGPGNVDGQSVT